MHKRQRMGLLSTRLVPILVALLAITLGLGCKRLKTGAQEQFAQKYSCPEARVEVRPRTDLRWSDVVGVTASDTTPPVEVKSDPERLAKWKKDREDQARETRERLDEIDVFEARGCDHSELLGCWHPGNEEGNIQTNEVSCQSRDYPPNIAPW